MAQASGAMHVARVVGRYTAKSGEHREYVSHLLRCKRARPHKGRPTSLIRDIRDRASGGNQLHEASHPSRTRPSEPNSTPPTGPAGLLMQPETASAINTGGPLHEPAAPVAYQEGPECRTSWP